MNTRSAVRSFRPETTMSKTDGLQSSHYTSITLLCCTFVSKKLVDKGLCYPSLTHLIWLSTQSAGLWELPDSHYKFWLLSSLPSYYCCFQYCASCMAALSPQHAMDTDPESNENPRYWMLITACSELYTRSILSSLYTGHHKNQNVLQLNLCDFLFSVSFSNQVQYAQRDKYQCTLSYYCYMNRCAHHRQKNPLTMLIFSVEEWAGSAKVEGYSSLDLGVLALL